MILEESKALWVDMMLQWNMNNGTDGFIEFYGTHHPGWKQNPDVLAKMVESGDITDHWIQEQLDRWFHNKDRFMQMAIYHAVDDNNCFFNWLIGKSLQN